jgi:hypothetical protein
VELLIPEFLFHRHRKEFPLGLEGVKGLAEVFQSSLTAMGNPLRDTVHGADGAVGEELIEPPEACGCFNRGTTRC